LSHVYVQPEAAGLSNLQAVGTILFDRDEIGARLTTVFCLGAVMFYYVVYRSRLVPRWLSGWGLVAAIPYPTAGLLHLLELIGPYSTVGVLMELPLALQEMVLAVWLIVKGFRPSAIDAPSAQ
jgi:hypothetical protein